MTSPELANQDGGLERAERLGMIQEYWRADAIQLNLTTGTPDERLAKGRYVVDLLALVEWEGAGKKGGYTVAQRTRRMNDLYLGGLRDVTYRHGGSMAPQIQYSHREWDDFLRTQIYSCVMHAGTEPPANHFELMRALHNGDAKFDYQ